MLRPLKRVRKATISALVRRARSVSLRLMTKSKSTRSTKEANASSIVASTEKPDG